MRDRADHGFSVEPTPGRCLRWAPDWHCSEATVLFDRNSGDYWVLSPQARDVIRAIDRGGSMTVMGLTQALDPGSPAGSSAIDLLPTLSSLVRTGLLCAWDNDHRLKVAPEDIHID